MSNYKITIDPGHGGHDPGASGNGYREKDLVLKLALDVEKSIKRKTNNIAVQLTRRTDVFIPLAERSNIANKYNATIFISIHFNSATSNLATGLETFSHIGSSKGKELARRIQTNLVNAGLARSNRGIKTANFSVLRRTSMPSALLETCFINNNADIQFYLKNYEKFVDVMSNTILNYFGVADTSTMPTPPIIVPPTLPKYDVVKDKVNVVIIGDHVAIDGFEKDGKNYVDVNGIYVGIREIFEAMDLEVGWDNKQGIVTVDTTGKFIKGSNRTDMLLLGNKINVEAYNHKYKNSVKVANDYIPIRDVFETLGFTVEYDDNNKMIVITK